MRRRNGLCSPVTGLVYIRFGWIWVSLSQSCWMRLGVWTSQTLDLWVSAAGNLSSLPESPAPPLSVAMFLRLCFAATLCALTAAAPGGLRDERSANGCDCSWIANDDCINQDAWRTAADSPTEALAHPVAPILPHARPPAIPASPVATAGATSRPGRTILHPCPRGSSEGSDHAVRGQLHHDAWRLLLPVPLGTNLGHCRRMAVAATRWMVFVKGSDGPIYAYYR